MMLEQAAVTAATSASTDQRPRREKVKGKRKPQAGMKPEQAEGARSGPAEAGRSQPPARGGGGRRRGGRQGAPRVEKDTSNPNAKREL